MQGPLYKKQDWGGMYFLFFCGPSQPVMFLICYLRSHSLRHGDTCWVGGDPYRLPRPHPATLYLGHMHSAGTAPRSPLWMEGACVGAGGWKPIPGKQGGSRRWLHKPPIHASLSHCTSFTKLRTLLRTPFSSCKALTPKYGAPTFHLALDYGALCDCTGHIHADSPEIS